MRAVWLGSNVFDRVSRAGGPDSPSAWMTGARLLVARLFYAGRGLFLDPWTPYRGAVAGRKCGPHSSLLGVRSGFGLAALSGGM